MRKTIGKSQYSEWNFRGLRDLENSFNKKYFVDVGIFKDKTSRKNKGKSSINNAQLGAIQEFGSITKNIPARSWLKSPLRSLIVEFNNLIKSNKTVYEQALSRKRGSRQMFVDIGKSAVKVIKRAFNTRGYGSWEDNADSTASKKGKNTPLKDTNQLRDSVSYRVGKHG